MTPAEEMRAASAKLRKYAGAASEGPWLYDSYSCILSGPRMRAMDELDPADTIEDYYETAPTVARVPAHHGDTAIGRRVADAEYIEMMHPGIAVLMAQALEDEARYWERNDAPESIWGTTALLKLARAINGRSEEQ